MYNPKYRTKFYHHKLATQPLRDLLLLAGRPRTAAQEHSVAALLGAYKRMRGSFPTPELAAGLDAIYSRAFSIANRVISELAGLGSELYPMLSEAEERSLERFEEGALKARSEASRALDREVAPILRHCEEVLFLALEKATTQINAALKAAKKR